MLQLTCAVLSLQAPATIVQRRAQRAPQPVAVAVDPKRSVKLASVHHAAGEISHLLSGHEQTRKIVLPELHGEDMAELESGAMLQKFHTVGKEGNEGLAAQIIEAPAEHVWQSLLDWDEWPRMVDDVCAADVYETDGDHVKVKVTLGIGILRIRTHVDHVIDRDAQTMTWSLDPSKKSDLHRNRGFWMIEPRTPTSCIVYYSVAIQTHKWAPAFLDRYIAREGFPRALGWLKREAESRFGDDA